ncbi:hypothetical protein [Pantoea anthophila]|uniref:hypothetical protein n=1 Tax=Pantoea anthophila TaxID=470931 RepID=UPI0006153989|nr:hypothetical protein [Pantoea anthophila]KKB04926.1 hypothetical protein TN98_09490 [Pantoea anthophila]
MIENSNEKLILDALAPKILRDYIDLADASNLILIKKLKKRTLEEMEIHIENVRKNGADIVGYSELKNMLNDVEDEHVYILSGSDKKFGFDLYFGEDKTKVLGVLIINLRIKSEDELKWERDKLGIVRP